MSTLFNNHYFFADLCIDAGLFFSGICVVQNVAGSGHSNTSACNGSLVPRSILNLSTFSRILARHYLLRWLTYQLLIMALFTLPTKR